MIGLLRQRNLPQTAFVDSDLAKELEKINSNSDNTEDRFPEHTFLALCAKNGISIEYLRIFTYVDVMKMLISFIDTTSNKETNKNSVRMATQKDIDKLLGQRLKIASILIQKGIEDGWKCKRNFS